MLACPYQDFFPYNNEVIYEKWKTEWNEKNENLKEIKADIRPWKENNGCRKDETVINRLRAGHTLPSYGHLMEGQPVPECELCHSHAMTVKHLLTDCINLASLRLRFSDRSNQNTLKHILGRNKVNSNTKEFLEEATFITGLNKKNEYHTGHEDISERGLEFEPSNS